MKRTVSKQIINNIVYVEPNYIDSIEEYDTNGLNVYETAPPLEDYCIYVNLEVETRGRNVQTSKTSSGQKLIMSFMTDTKGKSDVNFLQGSKIPIGNDGATINSLTTNYTDIFLGDIKKIGPSTETFGIKSIDIAYNNYMVPEVTVEFIDVRGVALFAQKEYYETNKNIDEAINSGSKTDIANTFFQCFFTFPYPKFTLMVKGFYGKPVSYELTCADFRARFDSSTGNFACTAKFVGYYFSFLNDVMLNGIVAAPYSDYIGSDYWAKRNFKLKGVNGEDVDMPKIGWLLNKMKQIMAKVDRESQSSPESQQKISLDQEKEGFAAVENAYQNFVSEINKGVGVKLSKSSNVSEDRYKDIPIVFRTNTNNGFLKGLVLLSPNDNDKEFGDYIDSSSGTRIRTNEVVIRAKYAEFIKELEKFNSEHSDKQLPKPSNICGQVPKQRVWGDSNSTTKAYMTSAINDDIKKFDSILYNKFKTAVNSGNKKDKNPLLEYKNAYFYNDNGFSEKLENYKENNATSSVEVERKIEELKDTILSEVLHFIPTVENVTKIVMAHFETFARMILETSLTICNEDPRRTISSLKVNDVHDLPDVKNKNVDPNCVVPPFPKVTKIVKRSNSTLREEAWVGDYQGDFRERDLVHGLINGIKEIAKDVAGYEGTDVSSGGGSESAINAIMKYPLSPLDMIASKKPYDSDGFDANDPSSLLGLVGLRAIQILGINNFSDWGEKAESLGKADAFNLLDVVKLSDEMINKLSLCADNLNDVMQMMYGNTSDTIKKPGDGSQPWPWKLDQNNGGIISIDGYLDICRVKDNAFSLPYQGLSWEKIKSETLSSPNGEKARFSEDYINSKSYDDTAKKNPFTFDTNIGRFSNIAESQIKDIENIEYYRNKIINESKYNSETYKSNYLTEDAEKVIAYIIENASAITPSDGSAMLPTSTAAFSDKSFGGGYNMNMFSREHPGNGSDCWVDKNKKEVKRKGKDGFSKYLETLSYDEFVFTEFCGLETNLKPFTKLLDDSTLNKIRLAYQIGDATLGPLGGLIGDTVASVTETICDKGPCTSIFGQLLYYKQTDDRSKALLFLASLGYAIDYKKIINNFFGDKSKTMAVIPLPAVMFAGALLWSEIDANKALKIGYSTDYYKDSIKILKTLRGDVKKKFIRIFETWVTKGANFDTENANDSDRLLSSFVEMKQGMELILKHPGRTYDEFFRLIPEIEDKSVLSDVFSIFDFSDEEVSSQVNELHKLDGSYNTIMDMLKGELEENFFENYITIDEDVYGDTNDFTRGIRLGNRDGGKASINASNFALAGCAFSKNSKFFNDTSTTSIKVNLGHLQSFFKGFLDKIKEEKKESTSQNTQISQAKEPDDSNTDIKIGIYRYCKMLYDKWIAGMSEEEFEEKWTAKGFFEKPDKYFHFIDAYYNEADFLTVNIQDFCDQIVSSWRNDQYSLLSFLSAVYAKNKFNFICVQNFIDLSKRENMESMFDTIPYTQIDNIKDHPDFIVMYPYESSNILADLDNSEYANDGFMLNQECNDTNNMWPEPLKSHNENSNVPYTIPAFGVSYGRLYQSYFKDIDVSMDNPIVTEQSIKAQFAIACRDNESEQAGDRTDAYVYGQDLYSVYSNNSYTCNVTMMGCAWVQPLMYFVLNNVPMFRGTYLIEKVSHHIEPGNMTTKFTGVRMSNVCTRIARENIIRGRNNQQGLGEANGDTPSVQEKLASVDNDCPYKTYPLSVINDSDTPTEYIKIVKKWEGGYVERMGTCGNMGVKLDTYRTYFGADKTCNDLKNMTDAEWMVIMKKFWDTWRADEINNKSIACLLVDWNWASGCYGIYYPQEVIGTGRNKACSVRDIDISTINNYPNQKELFQKLWERRKQHFEAIHLDPKYYKNCPDGKYCKKNDPLPGWLNRLNDFKFYDSAPSETSSLARNNDKHVSVLAEGFLNALNKTSQSSSERVEIGYSSEKSNGDTIWLTNGKSNSKFGSVFDMIINAYDDKVSDVYWILPGDGSSYNQVPVAYLVTVKEGSNLINIRVTSENNPTTSLETVPVSSGNDVGGIHESFCKALVKKYKPSKKGDDGKWIPPNEVIRDTGTKLDNYNALYNDKKYEIQKCNEAMEAAGITTNGGEVGELQGNVSNNVTNPKMKKVLSHINEICLKHLYNMQDKWRTVRGFKGKYPQCETGKCTYGPSTWYAFAGPLDSNGKPLSREQGNKYDLHFYPGPTSAKYENTYLKDYGFKLVWHGTIEKALSLKKSQFRPGDVSTQYYNWYHKNKNGARVYGPSAHGCMYTGTDWVSDFKQSSIMANSKMSNKDGRGGEYSVCLWRHPDFQEPGATIVEVT